MLVETDLNLQDQRQRAFSCNEPNKMFHILNSDGFHVVPVQLCFFAVERFRRLSWIFETNSERERLSTCMQ